MIHIVLIRVHARNYINKFVYKGVRFKICITEYNTTRIIYDNTVITTLIHYLEFSNIL